jgi:cobalt-zinc-cadmium efflux system membrane fusion protein
MSTLIAWARAVGARIPAVLTLALLGGIGLWGARNDWKLPRVAAASGEAKSEDESAAVQVLPDPAGAPSDEPGAPSPLAKRLVFPSAESVRKAGIKAEAAQVRPLTQYVTANGMLDYQPARYVRMNSPVEGRVWSVEKEMADPVKKGEVLLLIDSAEVGKARADFLQSLAQVNHSQEMLKQMSATTALLPLGGILKEQAALREARLRLFNDQQRLLNLGLPIRLKDVENLPEEQLVRHMRLLGLPDKVLKEHDAETLTANLLPLTAPFDGQVVAHPHAAPGDVVGGPVLREALFVIGDVSRLHIDLEVHPEDIGLLRVGQKVTFTPANAGGLTAVGELAHISPEVDEKTRNVPVHAEVDNPDDPAHPDRRLRPNTFGTGRVLVGRKDNTVAVPNEAIQAEGADSFVFVRVSDVAFQVRPVKPGLRDGQFTEVDRVAAGEEVVTTGSYVLKSQLFKDRIGGED